MTELMERDATAIAWAIRILNEAGYTVSEAGKAKQSDQGVKFRLDVHAATRYGGFEPQAQAVKGAAMQAPEFGADGEPIEDDE